MDVAPESGHMLKCRSRHVRQKRRTQRNRAGLHCDINPPPYTPPPTTEPLSTVSTISSNYRPPLIDMNNNRGELLLMVNIIVPDKRPNTADHTLEPERAEGDVWAAASQRTGGGHFTTHINPPPESRFITGSPITHWTGLQKIHFHSQIHDDTLLFSVHRFDVRVCRLEES